MMEELEHVKNQLQNKPKHPINLYLNQWGYYSGYPTESRYFSDSSSLKKFGRALMEALNENHISWSIYDYNSGMAIRDSLGQPTPILKAINLN